MAAMIGKKSVIPESRVGEEGSAKRNILRKGGGVGGGGGNKKVRGCKMGSRAFAPYSV